jgi:hypothetical protein
MDSLNFKSKSNEIYSAMLSYYDNLLIENSNKIDKYREDLNQTFSKAPTSILDDKQRAYWEILNLAELEILDIQKAYDTLQYFLMTLLTPTGLDVYFIEYKKARIKLMQEIGGMVFDTPRGHLDKHFMTIDHLHTTFIMMFALTKT